MTWENGTVNEKGRNETLVLLPPFHQFSYTADTRWSFDFVSDTLVNGRRIRVLTVIDKPQEKILRWKWIHP